VALRVHRQFSWRQNEKSHPSLPNEATNGSNAAAMIYRLGAAIERST